MFDAMLNTLVSLKAIQGKDILKRFCLNLKNTLNTLENLSKRHVRDFLKDFVLPLKYVKYLESL